MDVYGDVKEIGKKGTDIQNGKCTWLAVTALERCTPNERKVFKTCYGSDEPAHYFRLVELYRKLEIPKLYHEYQYSQYLKIKEMINNLSTNICTSIFSKILDNIYDRRC